MTSVQVTKLITAVLLSFVFGSAFSQNLRGIPDSLFGIKLGAILDIGKGGSDLGDVPVKRFTGANRFLGQGIHYFYEPLVENKYFPFYVKRKNSDDEFFETSHRMYLLPIIPDTIKKIDELDSLVPKYIVTSISWYDESPERSAVKVKTKLEEQAKSDDYFWAVDLCKTLATDISIKPEIFDLYEYKDYRCTFIEGDKKFEVSSFYRKNISLAFTKKKFDAMNAEVETKIRKLRAKDVLPR